jgi:hypothetical protein
MAVQVSHPGIYIDEFAPGAPIEGVGTSTAALTGVALKGPIAAPTLVQSWDAFVEIFGGLIADAPTGFLAPAVYGFFLNGGTACYVTRAATGAQAAADLDSREPVSPPPVIVATAVAEGPAGNQISVQVSESSLLAALLQDAGSPDTSLAVHFASTAVTSLSPRDRIVVASVAGFAVNDRVHLEQGANDAAGIIKAIQLPDTLVLTAPVPGVVNFAGGTVFVENLVTGRKRFRVTVPSGLVLNQALPQGATIAVAQGPTTEIATVDSAGGDTVTLSTGLANSYDTSTPGGLPTVASLEFTLHVSDGGVGEAFEHLAANPTHPRYWGKAVSSDLVTLAAAEPPPSVEDFRPAAGVYALAGGVADDRAAAWNDVTIDPVKYLDLLKPIDEVAIVAIPGATDPVVQQAVRDHCEAMADRFGILDGVEDPSSGFVQLKQQFANVRSARGFVALYYPWIVARSPLTGLNQTLPPSGHLAGVYARSDAERGVHKAPANTGIRGALGLTRRLTDEQQGPLNLAGINVLRVFPEQAQPVVWGARTTATDANWQYVNVRRLFLYVEESIEEGIHWAIFEPNNLQLWQKLKRSISEFLDRVWRDGALFGETAADAFYVRIDEALNPPSEQAKGRLYIEIGVRPTYPAEFIVVRIGIWQGASEVTEG